MPRKSSANVRSEGGATPVSRRKGSVDVAPEDPVEEVQQLTLRVPRDIHVALKVVSQATGRSANELGVAALRDFLSDEGHREAVDRYIEETRSQYRVALDRLADL